MITEGYDDNRGLMTTIFKKTIVIVTLVVIVTLIRSEFFGACTFLISCIAFIINTCSETRPRFNSKEQKKCLRGIQSHAYFINIPLLFQ